MASTRKATPTKGMASSTSSEAICTPITARIGPMLFISSCRPSAPSAVTGGTQLAELTPP